jgi:hypothetical protein
LAVPLNGELAALSSALEGSVKVPVLTGVPLKTTQPSYFHPSGKVGRVKPATAGGFELSRNQTPLASFVSSKSVGVAKIYFPQEVEKSPTILVEVTFAELPEKSPANNFVGAGVAAAIPVSPAGSIESTNFVAVCKIAFYMVKD